MLHLPAEIVEIVIDEVVDDQCESDVKLPAESNFIGERELDVKRLGVALEYWLEFDPHASWRMLIWRLDDSDIPGLNGVADDIRSYAEPLTGQ